MKFNIETSGWKLETLGDDIVGRMIQNSDLKKNDGFEWIEV